jgi:hypothetical protein
VRNAGDGVVLQVLNERPHHSPIELFRSWPIVLDNQPLFIAFHGFFVEGSVRAHDT